MRAAALVVLAALVAPARAEDRIVTKAEIIAPRLPADGRKAPLELESLIPIEQTSLVVSTHRSEERAGEVTIWMKLGGGYRRLTTLTEEPGMGSYAVRHFRYDGRVFLVVSFMPLISR